MKRTSKINLISLIIVLIVFTSTSKIEGLYDLPCQIGTKITNLSWAKTDFNDPGEGYSYFDFIINYQIHNPLLHKITITIPYCNLGFVANMSLDFVDENLEAYNYGYFGLCAFGSFDVDPGISSKLAGYMLAINETGLTILPDGIYTLWVFCYGVADVIYNKTILKLENGVADITFGEVPSLTIGYQFTSLVLFGSIIISTWIIIRKRSK